MHWKDKRYCSHSCIAWFEFSFLLACLLTYVQYPTNVEFIALLTEPFSKETKAFKEERVAQVNCVSDGGNQSDRANLSKGAFCAFFFSSFKWLQDYVNIMMLDNSIDWWNFLLFFLCCFLLRFVFYIFFFYGFLFYLCVQQILTIPSIKAPLLKILQYQTFN